MFKKVDLLIMDIEHGCIEHAQKTNASVESVQFAINDPNVIEIKAVKMTKREAFTYMLKLREPV